MGTIDGSPARLLLIRHAESTWNARALWQGQADPPLSERGRTQARTAARALAGEAIRGIVSSDLIRASETAGIIAGHLGVGVVLDAGLREVDVGEWSGLTRMQIERRWPGLRAAWAENKLESTPGGELLSLFTQRVIRAMERAAHQAWACGGPVLVVGHSRVLSALDRLVGPAPTRPTNLSGRWFEVDRQNCLTGKGTVDLLQQTRGGNEIDPPEHLPQRPSGIYGGHP